MPPPAPRRRTALATAPRPGALLGVLLGLLAPVAARAEDVPPRDPALREAPLEVLPEVVVTESLRAPVVGATPLGPAPRLTVTQPVGVLAGEDLRFHRESSLGATLSREPGVSSTAFGPGAARPVVRGLSGQRVVVLESGLSTLDVAGQSDDHAVPVDPTGVERLEVLRGPALLRYGAFALSGAVYAHDGRVPEQALCGRFEGRLGGALGSADGERGGYARLSVQQGAWVARASGFARASDDPDIPGFSKSRRLLEAEGNPEGVGEARGRLRNAAAEASGASFGLSRVGAWGFAGAALSWFETGYGLPNEEDVTIELERLRVDQRGRLRCPLPGWKELSWQAAYVDYAHTELEGGQAGTVFDQEALDARLEAVHLRRGGFEGALGLSLTATDLAVTGDEALLPEARTLTGALFATEQARLSGCLTLDLGARLEATRIRGTGEADDLAVAAAAGLLWQPRPTVAWALGVGFAQRAPTAVERFADGPHVASGTYEVGDPDLPLEESFGLDLSFRVDGRRVSGSASLFLDQYTTFVALRGAGLVDAGSGLPVFAYEPVRARLWGGEVEAAWHAWRSGGQGLDLTFLADAVVADDLTHGEPLPRIPPLRVGCGVVFQGRRLGARVELLRALEQERTAEGELGTDGWWQLDAGVTWTLRSGAREAVLSLTGTNLLDDEIRLHSSFVKDLAPLRGASLRLALDLRF